MQGTAGKEEKNLERLGWVRGTVKTGESILRSFAGGLN